MKSRAQDQAMVDPHWQYSW